MTICIYVDVRDVLEHMVHLEPYYFMVPNVLGTQAMTDVKQPCGVQDISEKLFVHLRYLEVLRHCQTF